MHDQLMERVPFAARRDFDMLPSSAEIDVQPARRSELSALTDMGNRLVPGVQITEPELERYFAFDPKSILTFSRSQKLLGAVAFLYLNSRGHDALIFDRIDLTHPDLALLASRSDGISAIYVWAIAGRGKAMGGLGNVAIHLSEPRLRSANLYAHPSSADGRNLMVTLGFEPIRSRQQDLWRYERPWNRAPLDMLASNIARSFADARH
ncbi:hypothetical protein [Bradyrhizobium sp.]|jgi:hypothetical protein|uniref:hypothetical protein n=1 Tax=Bradyrhizobium sp. TaxID=376 RepID=UPI002DFBAFB6|nr:hypothetical protein [Bradyrhizobium sp.]